MDSARKTLIDIASVSQRVVNALTRYVGCKTVESFRLERVIISSRSVLEILNKKLPLEDGGHVDDRVVDWLNSKEPQVCLDTLNQMEEILEKKVEYSAKNFFKALRSASAQDNTDKAVKLFRMRQGYFHFLLTTEIWNHERNVYQRSHTSVDYDITQRTERAPEIQETTLLRGNSGYTSGVPWGNLVNQGKLSTILARLNALHCKDIHRRTLLLRQPDTCKWLPKTNGFKAWRRVKSSFLWLHGKAGAGKSVLSASVIGHLQNTLQDGELLLFFYCDFRNERSTNTAEVMRSLLSQLLQPLVYATIESRSLIDDLEEEGTLIVDDLALLASYISRVAQHFNRQPICIIDALDECNDIEELLDALIQLRNGGIRLFVTSRPLQIIKDGLSGLPSISMDAMNFEVAADIALHIKRELDSHRRLRILETCLKNKIGSALCDKADGMFRWVHCQLNTLKRCMTAVQIRKTLDDLPYNLDATYSRILLGIDENEREVVRQALYWLVAAFRPLELCQILEGLSIDIGRRVLDHSSRPVHGPALLDALGSLVTYDELMDLVTKLSHASVKEYLIADSTYTKYPMYHVAKRDAHTQLALLCMSYIPAYLKWQAEGHGSRNTCRSIVRIDNFDTTCHATPHHRSLVPPSESHPLLAYVQSSGFQHLTYVNPTDRKFLRAIETFELDVQLHPIEWERLRERSRAFESPWPALKHDLVLYILITFAPVQLLHLYIEDTQLKQKDKTNPLIYAAFHCKIEHATILLSKGACVDHKGWDLDGQCQVLPLEVAAAMQDKQMVNLFLTEGSPVPYKLFENIMKYRFSGHVTLKLLQTDEFVEWVATVTDKKSLLCLLNPTFSIIGQWLSEEDIKAIEQRFTQIGCDPSAWFDKTSLCRTVCAGHISIVKHMVFNGNVPLPSDIILHATSWEMICFLLDLGNDIHVTSPKGDTLLHLVIQNLKEDKLLLETVQALVGAGCNPFTCNLAGESPFHVAVKRGEYSIVEYLLSLDAPIPTNILLTASEYSIISFLLNKGHANVHALAANGDTVLHTALHHNWHHKQDQCLEVARLLINAGCNPYLPNVLGETPSHVAAKHGHLPAVQYLLSQGIPLPSDILLSVVGLFTSTATPLINFLLDNGADVHATSLNGDNLLCISVASPSLETTEEEHIRRIKILMAAGCSPHVCNKAGESLIHVAARQRYTIVLEYLVSLGMPIPLNLMHIQFDNKPHSSSMLDTRLTHFLLDKGCNMCVTAENGDTLLHVAARAVTEKDALYLAKLLGVQSGCSPSAFNLNQETPFHVASRSGYIFVIDYFLSLGATLPSDILLVASPGSSHRVTMIRYLIQHGADATSTDPVSGATPLHRLFAKHDVYITTSNAHEHDRLQCAKILIEAGCNPQSEDLDRKTLMHFAAQRSYISIIEYLLSRGVLPPRDILCDSTAKVLRFFLRNGVNLQSFLPILPLHHVLGAFPFFEEDHLELATILISAGCDPSVQNWLGETPLHIAAKNKHIAIVKYLLSQNATLPSDILLAAVPNKVSAYAEASSSIPLLRFLIQEGADTNVSTDDGDTPLHLVLRDAISNRRNRTQRLLWRAMEVLLNGGANAFIRNADGKSVIDLAEEGGPFFKDNFLRLVRNGTVHQMRTMPAEIRDHL